MKIPVVSVAISFPGSDRAVSEVLRYTANTVLQEQMVAGTDPYVDDEKD
jgi:hypothetical protein